MVEHNGESDDSENQDKRGIIDTGYGYGSGFDTGGQDFHYKQDKLPSKIIIEEIAQPNAVELGKHVP